MSRLKMLLKILPILPLILACSLTPTPTPTPTFTPTLTPSPTSTPTPAPVGECMIVAAADGAIAYTRPSTESQEFAPMAYADFPTAVGARTADGWLGFDPHKAQAANIGIFRLRWVQAAQVTTEGDCEAVEVVVGPLPTVCYDMPMEDTPVYALPDTSSTLLATLVVEQYAAVLGPNAAGDWVKLDLSVGNSGVNQQGWASAALLNVNGPCDSLPVQTP
jgi:hypothetical protein